MKNQLKIKQKTKLIMVQKKKRINYFLLSIFIIMNKAIKINPRKRILYMNLSNIYQKFGKHQESVFCKRIAAGSIVFKCKEEYGPFEIDKVQLNEKI